MPDERQATLRDVLAEVSLLDVSDAIKKALTQWSGVVISSIVVIILGQAIESATGWGDGYDLPSWVFWFFLIWFFLAILTGNTSYHVLKIDFYFPKASWLWSLPLAAYFLFGIRLIGDLDPHADAWIKVARLAGVLAWWFPFFLFVSVLNGGYRRLMEKRLPRNKTPDT